MEARTSSIDWLRGTTQWESLLLFTICLTDMLSTLFWVHTHQATEANPWMSLWLHHGDCAFCAAKLMSFVPFLIVAAYYRPRRPRMIAIALRGTLALYAGIYLASVGGQFMSL
jgi:hypothetical protein